MKSRLTIFEALEPRRLRAFALGDVLDPFSNTIGDYVPSIVASGIYSGDLADGSGAVSLLYVAPGDRFAPPIGMTLAVDHLILSPASTLALDRNGLLAGDVDRDPTAVLTAPAGQRVVTLAGSDLPVGATWRDVPFNSSTQITVAADDGDADLDGDVDFDDLARWDRDAALGRPVDYPAVNASYAAQLVGPVPPGGVVFAALPVVTHLEVPHGNG